MVAHSKKKVGAPLHCSLILKWKWTSPFIHHDIFTLKKCSEQKNSSRFLGGWGEERGERYNVLFNFISIMLWVSFHGNSEEAFGREPRKQKKLKERARFVWFMGKWTVNHFQSEVPCPPARSLLAFPGDRFPTGTCLVCLAWLAQSYSERPAAQLQQHCGALLCHRYGLCEPICSHFCHIRDCSVGASASTRGCQEKMLLQKLETSPQKAQRPTAAPGFGWEQWCPVLWAICSILFFFLQLLFSVSYHHSLLISMLIVGCLLLLKCAKIYSSGRSIVIKLQHL